MTPLLNYPSVRETFRCVLMTLFGTIVTMSAQSVQAETVTGPGHVRFPLVLPSFIDPDGTPFMVEHGMRIYLRPAGNVISYRSVENGRSVVHVLAVGSIQNISRSSRAMTVTLWSGDRLSVPPNAVIERNSQPALTFVPASVRVPPASTVGRRPAYVVP